LNAIPGVNAASLSWLGLFGGNYVGLNLYDVERPEDRRFTLTDYVSPRYFDTVGMRFLRGRAFTEADRKGSLPVAVVNEAFVRERIGGGQEAIGRRFIMTYADDRRPWTIVGIVRDAKYNDLRERKTAPMMWVPLAQAPFKITSVSLKVKSGADAAVVRVRAYREADNGSRQHSPPGERSLFTHGATIFARLEARQRYACEISVVR
jgi:MacB-like periplasmic core domain